MFSKPFFSVSSCISVSVIHFSTFSSWILLKKHYFGNLRNSLSAWRTGTGDWVMCQFWPNKSLCMTQAITSREELWLLTSKVSQVPILSWGMGCECTLSTKTISLLENSNHDILCGLLVQHGVLAVNPVDPITYLKKTFSFKNWLICSATNQRCQLS